MVTSTANMIHHQTRGQQKTITTSSMSQPIDLHLSDTASIMTAALSLIPTIERCLYSNNATQNQSLKSQGSATATQGNNKQPTVITHVDSLPCDCTKGNCISGSCRCKVNQKACGPLCHKGGEILKCRATIGYYEGIGVL